MHSFTVLDAPQRSPEWYAARCGRLTASCANDVLAKIKAGEAAARRDLRTRLVCERLTNVPQESDYINADMQRGMDLEPEACAAYEALTGELVDHVGFLAHTELLVGASPDGVLGDFETVVELKVPRSATHLRYLRERVLPPEHLAQVTALLWVSGASACDFFSYDPRFPPALRSFYLRVPRDDAAILSFELLARQFLREVQDELDSVRQLQGERDVCPV